MSQFSYVEYLKNGAQIGSFIVALLALAVAAYALHGNRILQRENIASNIWREYEKLALEKPKYFVLNDLDIDFEKRTFKGSREAFQQYQWLVSFTLTACEEVISVYKTKDWVLTVEHQIKTHRRFIKSDYFVNQKYK